MAPTNDTYRVVAKKRKRSVEAPKCPQPTAVERAGGILCHICQFSLPNKKVFDSHYLQHNSSDIIYTCVICQKEMASYASFRGHCYTQHLLKEKMRCDYCHKQFSKQSALQDHIDLKHKFKCLSCKKEFPSQKEMQIHQIIHNGDKPPFKCHYCEDKIDSIAVCAEHANMHSEYKYTCPICSKKTTNKENAVLHITTHFGDVLTGDVEYEDVVSDDTSVDLIGILCCFCDITAKNRMEFDLHFSTKHEDQDVIYSCNICGEQFLKYLSFANHCYFHLMKNKYKCEMCEKSFDRLPRLVVHLQSHHSEGSERLLECMECEKKFMSDSRLRIHLKEAHDIYNFRCPETGCDLTFDTMQRLIMHQNSHKTISNNWCRQCGLQFVSASSCKAHLDVHRSAYYACPVCTKGYKDKCQMTKHLSQHFSASLHLCKVCGKVYNDLYRLVEHTKIHNKTNHHACDQCGKTFATLQSLKQHRNLHSEFKPYNCRYCDKSFSFHSNWSKHLRNIHNIDPMTVEVEVRKAESEATDIVVTQNANEINETESQPNVIDNFANYELVKDKLDVEESIEAGINSMCSEISNEDEIFDNLQSEGIVELDSINPTITKKETEIFHEGSPIYAEFTDVLPVDTSTFAPVNVSDVTLPESVPPEYGPDFTSLTADLPDYTWQFLDLDNQVQPYIDPRLTIKEAQTYVHTEYNQQEAGPNYNADLNYPPLLMKVDDCHHHHQPYTYHYGYGDIADSGNRFTFMNTDVF